MSSYPYIQAFVQAVNNHNGSSLRRLLSINPGAKNSADRAHLLDPSDVDLYVVPEKFQPVVRAYIKVMRAVYVANDIDATFTELLELVAHLNRAAESQTNWICPAMINSSNELISVYQVRLKQRSEEEYDGLGSSSLERVANTINRAFKICLTDKNQDMASSKKACIHFFLASLIKIYFKLNRLELAKSMEKALIGTGLAIPTIVNSPVQYRKHVITYLYYSALLSLDNSEYALAEAKLLTAMEFLSCYDRPEKVSAQAEKLLMLLLPLKMHNHRTTLPDEVWDKFPRLKFVYKENLFDAVRSGNLQKYETSLSRFQTLFLKRHIYLLVVQMKALCLCNLFRRACSIYASVAPKTPHIVPFSALQVAVEFSNRGDEKSGHESADKDLLVTLEEVECVLANLIAGKLIKGYLSHGNHCIVLLKTEPFPKPDSVLK